MPKRRPGVPMQGEQNTRERFRGIVRGARGFTTVDLIIAALVVAILALVGSLALQQLLAGFRPVSAARQLAGALHTAQMKAIKTNANHRVTLSSPGTYQIYRFNAGWVADGGAHTLPPGISLDDNGRGNFFTSTSSNVIFTPTGGLSPMTPGTIYLQGTSSHHQYRITVLGVTGRIKIWKGW